MQGVRKVFDQYTGIRKFLPRFYFLYFLGFLFFLSLIGALFLWRTVEGEKVTVDNNLMLSAQEQAGLLDVFLQETNSLLQVTIEGARLQAGTDQVKNMLVKLKGQYRRYQDLLVTDAEGKVVSAGSSPVLNISDREYFKEVRRTGQPVITDAITSIVTGRPVVIVSIPILASGGQFEGLAAAVIDVRVIEETMNLIRTDSRNRSFIVDSKGNIFASPDSNLLQKIEKESPLFGHPGVKAALRGQSGVIGNLSPWEHERLGERVAYVPVSQAGWALLVERKNTDLIAGLVDKLAWFAALFTVMVIPIIAMFLWIIWTLMREHALLEKYNIRLTRLAITDSLTGLYNHRYFIEMADAQVDAARASGKHLSLLMFDLDFFKQYNDTYGHMVGDRLLMDLGKLMRETLGEGVLLARYGGDEFTVILEDTEGSAALELGRHLQDTVRRHSFFGEEGLPEGKVSISVGIACFPEHGQTRNDLVARADQALYRAKQDYHSVHLYVSALDELVNMTETTEGELLRTLQTLVTIVDAKDRYTYYHSERVTQFALAIARKMGLPQDRVTLLAYSSFLHDVGKIEISREILSKVEPLNDVEWATLKNHPQWGSSIVKSVRALRECVPAILHHHERFDGRGYPLALAGEDIPLEARIMAVADSFDAMTTERPYRKARTLAQAIEELQLCSSTQFDPSVVQVFLTVLETSDIWRQRLAEEKESGAADPDEKRRRRIRLG